MDELERKVIELKGNIQAQLEEAYICGLKFGSLKHRIFVPETYQEAKRQIEEYRRQYGQWLEQKL